MSLGGSALNQVEAVHQLNAEPFTDGEQQQEQAKFRQQLSARWEQSHSGLTADRQSGLAQKPSSEQNGAEAEAENRGQCRCVLSPSKEEGQLSSVNVRGRRTAGAEQENSETEYLDQPDYFGDDSSDDDEPAYLTEPASHKQP